MVDIIRETVKSNRVVIWEEVARDGAQAKTLLSGEQRVLIARATSKIFGEFAPNHLIFAAGYPSMCKEEYEIIAMLVDQVDTCQLATHGRAIRQDVELAIQLMKRAKYGRVSFALPISEEHSQIMTHRSARETLNQAIDIARYAVDTADGMPIDVAFGVASRVDPGFLAEAATALTEEGIASIKIGDSTGELFPIEVRRLFKEVLKKVPENVVIASHLHNDFGLALANNLETVQLGVRLLSTSWLGLGERIGLAATEQMLFALGYSPETISSRLNVHEPLWYTKLDLHHLTQISHMVSELLNIPLSSTNPVIGTNMNDIATGAYFNNPAAFKPFDPQKEFGVPPRLILTHLSNHSIVEKIANNFGYTLNNEQIQQALRWAKSYAFTNNQSVIPEVEFIAYLDGLTADN